MEKGPLHSVVYDLIKQKSEPQWTNCFQQHSFYIERIADADPGIGELSRYELRKLNEVFDRYREKDTWDVVEITHEFSEWKKNYPDPKENTSRQIPFRDLVEAVGRISDYELLVAECEESNAMQNLIGK